MLLKASGDERLAQLGASQPSHHLPLLSDGQSRKDAASMLRTLGSTEQPHQYFSFPAFDAPTQTKTTPKVEESEEKRPIALAETRRIDTATRPNTSLLDQASVRDDRHLHHQVTTSKSTAQENGAQSSSPSQPAATANSQGMSNSTNVAAVTRQRHTESSSTVAVVASPSPNPDPGHVGQNLSSSAMPNMNELRANIEASRGRMSDTEWEAIAAYESFMWQEQESARRTKDMTAGAVKEMTVLANAATSFAQYPAGTFAASLDQQRNKRAAMQNESYRVGEPQRSNLTISVQTSQNRPVSYYPLPDSFNLPGLAPAPAHPADRNPPCDTLYVGNLPKDASEDELKSMFSKEPGYKRLTFRTEQNGPICFVQFEDVSFATKALNELYGVRLHNSVKGGIRLSFSQNPLGTRVDQTGSALDILTDAALRVNSPSPHLTIPGTGSPYYAPPSARADRRRKTITCMYCKKMKLRCSDYENSPDGRCRNCVRFNQQCLLEGVTSKAPPLPPGSNPMNNGSNHFEFGVDPATDPELAMALRISMEEEKARLGRERSLRSQQQGTKGRQVGEIEKSAPYDQFMFPFSDPDQYPMSPMRPELSESEEQQLDEFFTSFDGTRPVAAVSLPSGQYTLTAAAVHYTISQDRTGNHDEVCTKLLAAQNKSLNRQGFGYLQAPIPQGVKLREVFDVGYTVHRQVQQMYAMKEMDNQQNSNQDRLQSAQQDHLRIYPPTLNLRDNSPFRSSSSPARPNQQQRSQLVSQVQKQRTSISPKELMLDEVDVDGSLSSLFPEPTRFTQPRRPSITTHSPPLDATNDNLYASSDLDDLFDGFYDLSMPTKFQDPLFEANPYNSSFGPKTRMQFPRQYPSVSHSRRTDPVNVLAEPPPPDFFIPPLSRESLNENEPFSQKSAASRFLPKFGSRQSLSRPTVLKAGHAKSYSGTDDELLNTVPQSVKHNQYSGHGSMKRSEKSTGEHKDLSILARRPVGAAQPRQGALEAQQPLMQAGEVLVPETRSPLILTP